jgi:gluconate 2-dehydrogenase gamma chain
MAEEQKQAQNISRRSVIAGAALVPVAAIGSAAQPAAADSALSPLQLRTLEAFVDRLIPKDELGPGATECGVAVYINRSLGDYLAPEKAAFIRGLEATDAFARRTEDHSFAELSPEKQDAVLTAMENGTAAGFPDARAYFARVRRLTLEGMFCDPSYGGNRNFAGWDLIRYPGPRLAVSPDDQKMGVAIRPLHSSAYGSGHGH